MNKTALVDYIADALGCTKADADRMIDAFIDAVQNTLKKRQDVAIPGLGKFVASKRAAREARNPRTGEVVHVAEAWVPKFRAAKGLKDAVK